MTLAIDASRSISTIQKTGVEKVSDDLLKQLIEIRNQKSEIRNNDFDFIFYTPQEISWLPQENQRILRWPFKFLWTQVRLAWELIFHPPEKMFFPVHAMPLLLIASYKLRVTSYYKVIHDIAFKKQPVLYSLKQKIILNFDLYLAKKLCAKIFVPTAAVRQDLIKYTKINPEKIIVTPWGYRTINNQQLAVSDKKKQILYIGRVEEKKNIGNLIKAFNIFSEQHPDYKLILAGKIDSKFPISNFQFPNNFQNPKSKSHNMIEFLGFVSEGKKHELLSESAALVLVSKEEGFGFPVLEAFDFGLPVVASDIPVIREIGGEACLYANPDSPESIAEQLQFILSGARFDSLEARRAKDPMSNTPLAESLVKQGYERLKLFSWPKTVEKILGEILNP